MINLEVILTADPAKLAMMMCYLAHDCVTCPACGPDGPDISQEACRRRLYSWIMNQKDEEFWRYIEGG
ncbi:hypothetical protein NIA71_01185 [Ihubacter massiliensis]|uniref:hypothetical protein n=1 Tax=Ihubacter massiliensis TaxID=1852367 RepID=UPI00209777FC|nr:hypothetical protein [Ihubacter massiliensis]MCI7301296.1 hypothetical protein [Clostridia bacterium]MCO7120568.1 hypothetical protein [Ihubacter massiliensis]MDY3010625.1 hypothetical protein [Clostridiales Family XIII bacterium]